MRTPYLYEDIDWENWENGDDQDLAELLIEKHPEIFDYGMAEEEEGGKRLSWDDWMDKLTDEKNKEDLIMGHLVEIGGN